MTYYCKNCDNIVGKWYNKYKFCKISTSCIHTESKNIDSINFLDCKNCKKFIGLLCYHVCENCFEKDKMIGEQNLFNWFKQYKKIISQYLGVNDICKICNKNDFKWQHWFFEELTFYKQ